MLLFVFAIGWPLVLCTATLAWAYVRMETQHRAVSAGFLGAAIACLQFLLALPIGHVAEWAHRALDPADDWFEFVGFGAMCMNLAAAPLVGVIVGCGAYVLERRRRELWPRACLRCGYDLTGNVSGRCPECGTEVDPSPGRARQNATSASTTRRN